MDITKKITDGLIILTISGRLDSHTSPELEAFFKDHVADSYQGLIADLANLEYISSAGLRVILIVSKKLKMNDKKFSLCNLQDNIHEIFQISGFDTFVDIRQSLEEALTICDNDK